MQGTIDERYKGKMKAYSFIHFRLPLCNQGLKFLVSFGYYDLHALVVATLALGS